MWLGAAAGRLGLLALVFGTALMLLLLHPQAASSWSQQPNLIRSTAAALRSREAAPAGAESEDGTTRVVVLGNAPPLPPPSPPLPPLVSPSSNSTVAACIDTSTLPRIHFPLSVTSRNLKNQPRTMEGLPLFQFALPSIIQTVEPTLFAYGISLGVDQGDVWYDNATHAAAMAQWWRQHWLKYWFASGGASNTSRDGHLFCNPEATVPFFEVVAYANTRSRNVWAVNYVTQRAYEAGYHYFYRINDDTQLYPNQWSSRFVAQLQASKPFANMGVTGPGDKGRNKKDAPLLTHSFVHRTHLEIFGQHFNSLFGNWYSDDWIQYIYAPPLNETIFGPNASLMSILNDVPVLHKVVHSRYEVKATRPLYERQLAIDREVIAEYVWKKLHPPPPPPPPAVPPPRVIRQPVGPRPPPRVVTRAPPRAPGNQTHSTAHDRIAALLAARRAARVQREREEKQAQYMNTTTTS